MGTKRPSFLQLLKVRHPGSRPLLPAVVARSFSRHPPLLTLVLCLGCQDGANNLGGGVQVVWLERRRPRVSPEAASQH